jgi:hypothetical protein
MVEWGCILVARLIGAMEIHYRSAARADLGIATLPFYCSVMLGDSFHFNTAPSDYPSTTI